MNRYVKFFGVKSEPVNRILFDQILEDQQEDLKKSLKRYMLEKMDLDLMNVSLVPNGNDFHLYVLMEMEQKLNKDQLEQVNEFLDQFMDVQMIAGLHNLMDEQDNPLELHVSDFLVPELQ